jgi:hypothetical protein
MRRSTEHLHYGVQCSDAWLIAFALPTIEKIRMQLASFVTTGSISKAEVEPARMNVATRLQDARQRALSTPPPPNVDDRPLLIVEKSFLSEVFDGALAPSGRITQNPLIDFRAPQQSMNSFASRAVQWSVIF